MNNSHSSKNIQAVLYSGEVNVILLIKCQEIRFEKLDASIKSYDKLYDFQIEN
jgi:hypothetical protein